MNEEFELFVGVPSVWRDDIETRVAANPDPFVQFLWAHFANFSEMLGRFWARESPASRVRFVERALACAFADFGNPQTIPEREAFPLEWFTGCIVKARK